MIILISTRSPKPWPLLHSCTFSICVLYYCNIIATEITSNVDGLICPGEEVVYTCMSQGSSQRWRLENDYRSILIEKTYARGQQPGRPDVRPPFTFTLVSSGQGQLKSTVSVLATTLIHNTVVECIDTSSRHSITIGIAGLVQTVTRMLFITNSGILTLF